MSLSLYPLKILMIAPTPYFADRGCHVRIYEEARALTKLGHEVCIVTYHLGRDMPGVRVVRIPTMPWYNKLEAGPSWHKPYLDILLLFKALSEARTFHPDLIHSHLHEGALIGSFLKRVLHIPLLFDYQGSLTGESLNHGFLRSSSFTFKIFKALESLIDNQADHIITSSDKGRLELIHDWNIAPEKVTKLIDGVDLDVFRGGRRVEARRELGIYENTKLVVYLGLFNSYQGVDLLLDAISKIKSKASDVIFLLMGFPDAEYKIKAEEKGISDVIRFTGRVDYDKAALFLNSGDLAVSPKLALTEANGKLFNYMACGLPTVVFDNQINREILGDEGIYVEHGNTAMLAESILSTINNAELLKSLSKRVRKRAEEIHSWESRAEDIDLTYRNLLKTGR